MKYRTLVLGMCALAAMALVGCGGPAASKPLAEGCGRITFYRPKQFLAFGSLQPIVVYRNKELVAVLPYKSKRNVDLVPGKYRFAGTYEFLPNPLIQKADPAHPLKPQAIDPVDYIPQAYSSVDVSVRNGDVIYVKTWLDYNNAGLVHLDIVDDNLGAGEAAETSLVR